MAESENRTLLNLHIVRCGDGNLGMPKHPLGGYQSKTGIDLTAELLSERVQWRAGDDTLGTEPADQLDEMALAAVVLVRLAIIGRAV